MAQWFGSNPPSSLMPIPPPQAAQIGYTNLLFADEFDSPSTIALTPGATPTTGYNWYPYIPNNAANEITSAGFSVANSVLTITNDNSGYGFDLCTINSISPTIGTFNHAYFEAYIAFNQAGWQGGSTSWPAFWSETVNSNGGTAPHWGELDFFEAYPIGTPTGTIAYITTLHEWTLGTPNTTVANNNNNPTIPSGTNFSQFHKYGCLWTPGSVTWYFDGVAGSTVPCGPGTSYPSLEAFGNIYLILGTGNNWPMMVDYVRVWGPATDSVVIGQTVTTAPFNLISTVTQFTTVPLGGSAVLPTNTPIGTPWTVYNDGANTLTLSILGGGLFLPSGKATTTIPVGGTGIYRRVGANSYR